MLTSPRGRPRAFTCWSNGNIQLFVRRYERFYREKTITASATIIGHLSSIHFWGSFMYNWPFIPVARPRTTSCMQVINPTLGWGSLRFSWSRRQTPGASELKLYEFVGTFIAHIFATKNILRVRSGQVTKTDHVTRPRVLKFEVVQKPEFSS